MKIALVYSKLESHWLSCQFITRNLLASYASFINLEDSTKCQLINFHKDLSFYETEKLVLNISEFRPDIIIFLDHTPHPHELINLVLKYYSKINITKLPNLIFHVYGDFPLLSEGWLKVVSSLKKFKTKWICASECQVEVVSKFLKNSIKEIYVVPFPIDDSKYYFDEKIRNKLRKDLQLKEKEVVFVYSGRISYQKRIQDLLSMFDSLLKTTSMEARLILIGPFDNLGNPYIGEHFHEGEYVQKLLGFFSLLDQNTKERISYLGCVEEEVLNKVYNASDIFVSLSTHNDEDYGMSPAEALCTGLPAILTNWGGYSSFKFKDNNVHLVPIKINQSKARIDINSKDFQVNATKLIENINLLRMSRLSCSQYNASQINIESVSLKLNHILKSKFNYFSGFTSYMIKFDTTFKNRMPFITNQPRYSNFYSDIYESYISKKY